MQEHRPQETVRNNSCGIYTFLVIHVKHGNSPNPDKPELKIEE